jgi:hypothetical protein
MLHNIVMAILLVGYGSPLDLRAIRLVQSPVHSEIHANKVSHEFVSFRNDYASAGGNSGSGTPGGSGSGMMVSGVSTVLTSTISTTATGSGCR